MTAAPAAPDPWSDAVMAAALLAIDPAGLGGAVLRGLGGPGRDRWLAALKASLPAAAPLRRVPLHVTDSRLLGGLDLAATLRAGRPVAERGILADADGGIVLLPTAERLSPGMAARLAVVLDTGEVAVERDGIASRHPARLGLVAIDEGLAEDERLPEALLDRLAFRLELGSMRPPRGPVEPLPTGAIGAARELVPRVEASLGILEALCATAMALGIPSVRATLLALRAARAAAALAGRAEVLPADASLAARLVLAPRATMLPVPEEADEAAEPPPPEPPAEAEEGRDQPKDESADPLAEVVLAAAEAAIPPGLLARLHMAGGNLRRARASGRAGALKQAMARGRPAGVRRGEPKAGARLNVVETLRAAAPWQPLRRQANGGRRIEVRHDDFRVTRLKHKSQTTSVFVVDASGSAAFHRLAEAKGAVELLLADCYVRRDQVALLAFRGRGAELLLPPTRSLVRAKRSLAGLPGGGGTPLAAGIDAALAMADAVRRRGETPVLVFLTDGRANVARDGIAGRARAEAEALAAARQLRATGVGALVVDTSPKPQPSAKRLAEEMSALYLPLPYADAAALSTAVRAAASP